MEFGTLISTSNSLDHSEDDMVVRVTTSHPLLMSLGFQVDLIKQNKQSKDSENAGT